MKREGERERGETESNICQVFYKIGSLFTFYQMWHANELRTSLVTATATVTPTVTVNLLRVLRVLVNKLTECEACEYASLHISLDF